MRFLSYSFLLLCLWPCIASARQCTVEEQAVFSAVLRDPTDGPGRWVSVIEQTTDNSEEVAAVSLDAMLEGDLRRALKAKLDAAPSGSTVILAAVPPGYQRLPNEVREDLERNHQQNLTTACTIPKFSTDAKFVRFLASSQIRRMFSDSDPKNGWREFHQRFGENADLVTFSPVVFDRKRQYALVHVSSGIAAMGAGGVLYLLERKGNQWDIIRAWPTWTT